MVIILVLEGKHSHTEINFFKNLANWTREVKILPIALEKARVSEKRKKEIVGDLKEKISKYPQRIESDNVFAFFIGDGDSCHDLKAMENTKKIVVNYFEEKFKDIKVDQQILMEKGQKFESLYKKILVNETFPSNPKKGSNKNLFNNFAEKANWITVDSKLNWKKIIKDMKRTKNPHLKIFEKLDILVKSKL